MVGNKPVPLDSDQAMFPASPRMVKTGDVFTIWFADSAADAGDVVVTATGRLCGKDATARATSPSRMLAKGQTVETTLMLANNGATCSDGGGTAGASGCGRKRRGRGSGRQRRHRRRRRRGWRRRIGRRGRHGRPRRRGRGRRGRCRRQRGTRRRGWNRRRRGQRRHGRRRRLDGTRGRRRNRRRGWARRHRRNGRQRRRGRHGRPRRRGRCGGTRRQRWNRRNSRRRRALRHGGGQRERAGPRDARARDDLVRLSYSTGNGVVPYIWTTNPQGWALINPLFLANGVACGRCVELGAHPRRGAAPRRIVATVVGACADAACSSIATPHFQLSPGVYQVLSPNDESIIPGQTNDILDVQLRRVSGTGVAGWVARDDPRQHRLRGRGRGLRPVRRAALPDRHGVGGGPRRADVSDDAEQRQLLGPDHRQQPGFGNSAVPIDGHAHPTDPSSFDVANAPPFAGTTGQFLPCSVPEGRRPSSSANTRRASSSGSAFSRRISR